MRKLSVILFIFHASELLLLTLDPKMVYWMQCYEQLYVFSLQLILDGSECPLNVISFSVLRSNRNFRELATDEDIIHHPTFALPEHLEINTEAF